MVTKLNSFFKRITVSLLAVFLLLTIFKIETVSAENTIESIDIKAEIQDDGSVIITDHRIFYADKGTEHYVVIGNLDDSELYDYKVFDENGFELENTGSWDTNASLEEKAGKYGINYTGNSMELCFGIGEYGRRDFTLQYRVTNFVRNLNDNYQAIYWKFINDNLQPLERASITITNNKGYEFVFSDPNAKINNETSLEETNIKNETNTNVQTNEEVELNTELETNSNILKTRLWGFGFRGNTAINSDKLLAMTSGNFTKSNYIVLLSIFEGKVFNTTGNFDISSESLIEKAKKGSYIYKEDMGQDEDFANDYNDRYNPSFFRKILKIVPFFFYAIIPFIFASLGISKKRRNKASFKAPKIEDVDYYREVPYDNFINTDYIMDNQISDIISAFIIKWINKGLLKDDVEEVGLIFKKEELALRILSDNLNFDSSPESELWEMVIKASKGDGVLSQKEFNSYISRNIDEFNSWVKSITTYSRTHLLDKGLLVKGETGAIFKGTTYELNDNSKQLQRNIVGFKKYLKDFSLLNERGMSESGLWKDYMEWAAYMGIAKEVYEQFKVVDPGFVEYAPYSPTTIIFTNSFGRSIQNTYNSVNAASSLSTSSSGGGGSSFGGGGGGSFGGGSGGGTR